MNIRLEKQVANLTLVVPVFNEAESIDSFLTEIDDTFGKINSIKLEIIFINDGSEDGSLEILLDRQKNDHRLKILDRLLGCFGRYSIF